jgi:uncharacterized protein YbbC (DUF1343 family)
LILSCGYGSDNDIELNNPKELDKKIIAAPFLVGAERTNQYVSALEGKKVGIVGNQSSLIEKTHLVDSLVSLGIDVQRVFSPEHGFRGTADAGEIVANGKDVKTGLPVISLYGSNKKPTKEQLVGLDIMVFDIQDVGVRFYTYISTLHYIMEACAEAGIPLILLDRPNPNGHYVDGPVLELAYKSFVGMHQVPIVYGMTIGEYGQMINGEKWLKNDVECDLTVIACQNYWREMHYSLPVAPSPNLRSDVSIQLYPGLCLLEATTVSVGRGTDGPFERYGHPGFPKTEFSFTPESGPGSKNPKLKGRLCHGYNLNNDSNKRVSKFDLSLLLNASKLLKGKTFIDRQKAFNGLAGNSALAKQLAAGTSEETIRASWKEDLDKFKIMREKYLLY